MIRIVSAIDESTRPEFEQVLVRLANLGTDIQIDLDDGSFSGYKTVHADQIADLLANYKQKINFEAHLMVQQPFEYIPKLIESGVRKFFLQYEIDDNMRNLLENIEKEDCLVGLAIGPETPVADVEPFLELVDSVNIMTVTPGRQGQPFEKINLDKIRDLKNIAFPGEIEVDGGIDDKTILQVKTFDPNTLVVGHFLTKAEQPVVNYQHLLDLLRE